MSDPERAGGQVNIEVGGLVLTGWSADRGSSRPRRMWKRVRSTVVVLAGLVATLGPWNASARVAWQSSEPLGPTTPFDLAGETRLVARDVTRNPAGGIRAATGVVRIPKDARVIAPVAIAPDPQGRVSVRDFTLVFLATGGAERVLASLRLDPQGQSSDGGWHILRGSLPLEEVAEGRFEVRGNSVGPPAPRGRALLGMPRLLTPSHGNSARPNIILLSLDTLRADRLSAYGAKRPTTPRMDALAATGARFSVALAPASSTPPSHMTLLTGTSPCRHGIWGVHEQDQLPETISPLAEILSRHGYTTAAITENAYIGSPYGFARGFDSFREQKEISGGGNSVTPRGLGPTTFAAARHWLREHRDLQFFLFVHTYQMHGPRRPLPPYAGLFEAEGPTPDREGYDPAFHDLRVYDQLLREADDLVGELHATVRELGLAGDTIFVITSDHGEAFFEHGDHGHGYSLYEEVVRVPLVVWAPGRVAPGVIDHPVGLVDVTPTLLDLLELPLPDGLDGHSIVSRLGAPSGTPAPARALYMETAPGNVRGLRGERYKILRFDDGRELSFDLLRDPGEKSPLGITERKNLAALKSLRAELDRQERTCLAQRKRAAEHRSAPPLMDPARREKLRALGYLD